MRVFRQKLEPEKKQDPTWIPGSEAVPENNLFVAVPGAPRVPDPVGHRESYTNQVEQLQPQAISWNLYGGSEHVAHV